MPEAADSFSGETSDNGTPGDALARKISLVLAQGPAWILVTSRTHLACQAFLDKLSMYLAGSSHILRITLPSQAGLSPAQLYAEFGMHRASVHTRPEPSKEGNTYILCHANEQCGEKDLEQLRQLSNLQPPGGHLGIVLCGKRQLLKQMPPGLRQRIASIYPLDRLSSHVSRPMLWGGTLAALAIAGGLWLLAQSSLPPPRQNSASPFQGMPEASLEAGPILTRPEAVVDTPPVSHIFQTEAEAEARLFGQNKETATIPQ